jgi:uncharacterized protein (DUF983 family)
MDTDKPAIPLLVSGLFCRCPRCGRGPLFDGYLRIAPACTVCGLSFAGHDTGDGPAFFIILPLSIITCVLALLVEVKLSPPQWVHLLIWPLFIAISVGGLLRPVKSIMVALQYRYRDVEHAPGTDGQ